MDLLSECVLIYTLILSTASLPIHHSNGKPGSPNGKNNQFSSTLETIGTLILNIQKTFGKHDNINFPKVLMVDEDAHSTVFTRILDQVNHGHVSQEQLLRWMQQINDGITRGTIAQKDLDAFTATLHRSLEGTAFANECCLFGKK